MRLGSVTLETSHSLIGPCGLLEQSPSGDSSRHALTAPLSSVLDCAENAARGWNRAVGPSCKVGTGSVRVNVYILLARVRVMPNVHLRAHHCKNSATCRQGALGTRSKDTKANESVDIGGLLCFCLCRVFLGYLLGTVRASGCMHGWLPKCVGTLQCF